MANDLVVQLGAKLDQFQSDMNQAGDIADSAVSKIEQSFANLNPTLGGFAKLGLGITGVVGSAYELVQALAGINSELAQIQKSAAFSNISTDRFQQIQFAAGQGGVDNKQSAADLEHVSKLLADAKYNENSLTKILDENNIKYKDRNGQIINLNQLLTIAGGLLGKFDSIPDKTKAAQMLGLSEGWVEALRNGSKSFEDIAQSANEAGAVIDAKTIAKAAEFDREWKRSSAQLGAQFKSALADVGGYIDGLIEKANGVVDSINKVNGTASGSGQSKFDAYAVALSIWLKELVGAKQDVDQLTSSINRMVASGSGDPEIIAGLELIRAKAELAAKMVQQVGEQQSKSEFPSGVPLPASRPAAADKPTGTGKIPTRGADTANAYDRATESITKHTARLEADAETAGKGEAAQAELRAEYQLTAAAQQAGIPITDKVRNQIQDLAQDAGLAAEALAKAKVASDIEFGAKSAFLTPQDLAIAQQLRKIYGDDVPAAMQSSEAAALRFNATLKQIGDLGQQINSAFLVDFTQQIRNGASAMDALKSAGLNALGKISDKLAQMAADQLWASAFGGSGGGGFNIGSLFGVGGSGGAVDTIQVGSQLFPKFAAGTNFAPGGPSIVGENGPELVNLPRGSQVIPNDALRNGMGGGSVTVHGGSVVIQGDASEKTVALIQAALAQHDAALPGKVVSAVKRAQQTRNL